MGSSDREGSRRATTSAGNQHSHAEWRSGAAYQSRLTGGILGYFQQLHLRPNLHLWMLKEGKMKVLTQNQPYPEQAELAVQRRAENQSQDAEPQQQKLESAGIKLRSRV